jgi:hypothetical protein
MLAKVNSAALYGIDALRVEVEIDPASGLPHGVGTRILAMD